MATVAKTPARRLKGVSPKEVKPSKPKILIFGKPGVGKTWTSLDFPSVYYIDTEGGANLAHYIDRLKKSGGQYFGPSEGSRDFDSVLEEIKTLASVEHGFKTVVIDSYSKLFNNCVDESAERLKREGRKIEFGVEKKDAVAKSRRLCRLIDQIDMNVVLICHEKAQWANGEQIGDTFDGWEKLEYELHLAMRITDAGGKRLARVTKSRLEAFPKNESFPWSFDEFANRYGIDSINSEVQQIEYATEAQLDELDMILTVAPVQQDVLDKWKTKAGVDEFKEMTSAAIQELINWCKNRVSGGKAE